MQYLIDRLAASKLTRYDNSISLAAPCARIYPTSMSAISLQRLRSRDIPKKHCLVPSNTDKTVVPFGDCDIEDLVTVGGVGLDQLGG